MDCNEAPEDEKAPQGGLHAHRIAGRDRRDRDSHGDSHAGAESGAGTGPTRPPVWATSRIFSSAWILYADDNNDKIVNGDSGEYDLSSQDGGYWAPEGLWDGPDGTRLKKQAIMDRALYPYTKIVKVYKCPNVT